MKIVINSCYGGFGLSYKAVEMYFQLKGWNFYAATTDYYSNGPFTEVTGQAATEAFIVYYFKNHIPDIKPDDTNEIRNAKWELAEHFYERNIPRTDPDLIKIVEGLGSDAYGRCAKLTIHDIPQGLAYRITEYDGYEGIEYADEIGWSVAT